MTGDRLEPAASPWGIGATLGLTLLLFLVDASVQLAVTLAWVLVRLGRGQGLPADPAELASGLVLALGTIAGAVVAGALLLGLVRARRLDPGRWLGLDRPAARPTGLGLLGLGALIALFEWSTWLSGRPLVPPFLHQAMASAGSVPLLVLAVVAFGPAFEEGLFRGFLFAGCAPRLGTGPTVVLATALWTSCHLQYDAFLLAQVFVTGLYLGWVRARTGSLTLTFLLHAAMNLVATVEALVDRL